MTDFEKMKSEKVFFADTPELLAIQEKQFEILYDYNHARPAEHEKKQQLMQKFFAEVGEDCYFEVPLHANWGLNTHVGKHVYANFNLTLVDDNDIYIGDNCMFAPNVVIATAGHPIEPTLRLDGAQYNIPVHIGNNVWIGANAVILPGVHIGDNTVIGAGSVVTKDIPADVVAYGNPCRVVRPIGERDKAYYFKNRKMEIV